MKTTSFILPHPVAVIGAIFTVGILPGCKDELFPAQAVPTKVQIAALAEKTEQQLLFVEGGGFEIRNFTERSPNRKQPAPDEMDEQPVHRVKLSDFSIGKYKVTLGDYDLYAAANGRPPPYTMLKAKPPDRQRRGHAKSAAFPAGVSWSEAQGYGWPQRLPRM